MSKITVSTDQYKTSHNTRPTPKSYGRWRFQVGNKQVMFVGYYIDGITFAKEQARQNGYTSIAVLP